MTFARQSLASLAALVFGLVVSVVLARALGPAGRGEYQLAVRVAGLVMAFAQWGMPEVMLQVLAERPTARGALVGTSLAVALGATVVGAILVLLVLPAADATVLRGVDPTLVLAALAGSAFAMVALLMRRFLQLAGALWAYNGLDVARNALFLGLAVALTVSLGRQADGALGAWFVSELALAGVAALYVWRRVVRWWQIDTSLAAWLLRAGVPVQLGVVATYVGNEGGAYVVNARLGLEVAGVYTVALSVARLVLQISGAMRTTLQPRLMGAEVAAADVTARATRHGLAWMALVSICLALASPLVPRVFGAGFSGASQALLGMLPGMVGYGVMQLLAGHLLRVGQRAVLAASSWTLALASIGLQAVGAQAGGLVGAAVGLSLAYLLAAAIVVAAFARAARISPARLLPGADEVQFYRALVRHQPQISREPDTTQP